jgi:A/G-specific adenine glycosylase
VTIFPMRKEKKASREENEVVCITEWRGGDHEPCWLFVKRPEKGDYRLPVSHLDYVPSHTC